MGRMTREELIRKIDLWHTGISKMPLYEFIGVTKEEFDEWLINNVVP